MSGLWCATQASDFHLQVSKSALRVYLYKNRQRCQESVEFTMLFSRQMDLTANQCSSPVQPMQRSLSFMYLQGMSRQRCSEPLWNHWVYLISETACKSTAQGKERRPATRGDSLLPKGYQRQAAFYFVSC